MPRTETNPAHADPELRPRVVPGDYDAAFVRVGRAVEKALADWRVTKRDAAKSRIVLERASLLGAPMRIELSLTEVETGEVEVAGSVVGGNFLSRGTPALKDALRAAANARG